MSTKLWSVGHNMAGYLPESDPYLTADWEHAKSTLIEDLEQHSNSLEDMLTGAPITVLSDEQLESYPGGYATIVLENPHPDITDRDKQTLEEMKQCEEARKEIKELDAPTGYLTYIEDGRASIAYWINEVSREDAEVPQDLEGEELEQFIDRLNQQC